jgi:hypothetical protein
VSNALATLNISRWKTSGDIRNLTQQNAASIQKDIDATLPGLITQADAASGSVPPAFAVYRNVDALYDVLLRVAQTADMGAPQSEASSLQSALSDLESARSRLAQSILATSQTQETELTRLRTAIKTAAAPPPAPPHATVVDDGPAKTTVAKKRKKKPAATPDSSSSTPTTSQPKQPQ